MAKKIVITYLKEIFLKRNNKKDIKQGIKKALSFPEKEVKPALTKFYYESFKTQIHHIICNELKS